MGIRIVRVVVLAVAGAVTLLMSPIFAGDTQDTIGLLYDSGYGVAQDYREAVRWYRKAAGQGNASAQLSLALKYALGQGVAPDYVKACMWVTIASAQNGQQAIQVQDFIEKYMSIAQIYEGQRLAHEWMWQHSKYASYPISPPTSNLYTRIPPI